MIYDITFCANKKCKNTDCKRNHNNIDEIEYTLREIWVGNFPECENWRSKGEH